MPLAPLPYSPLPAHAGTPRWRIITLREIIFEIWSQVKASQFFFFCLFFLLFSTLAALDHALTIFAEQRNKFNLRFMRMFDHFLIKIQSNVKFKPLERQLQSAACKLLHAACRRRRPKQTLVILTGQTKRD